MYKRAHKWEEGQREREIGRFPSEQGAQMDTGLISGP